MSDFKATMHQIRLRLGLCLRPRWGAYSAPPDPLAGFKGAASRQGGGREKDLEREGDGKGREDKGREGRETEWRREGERDNVRDGSGKGGRGGKGRRGATSPKL